MEVFTVSNNEDNLNSTLGSIGDPSDSTCKRVFKRGRRPSAFGAQNHSTAANEEFSSSLGDIASPTEAHNRSVFRRTGRPPAVDEQEDIGNEATFISDILQPTEQSFQRVLRQGRVPPQVVSELGSSRNADSSQINKTGTTEGSDSFRKTYSIKEGGSVLAQSKEHSKLPDTDLSDSERSDAEVDPIVLPVKLRECSVLITKLEIAITPVKNGTFKLTDAEGTRSSSMNRTEQVKRVEDHTHSDVVRPKKRPSVSPQEARSLNIFQDSFDISELDDSETITTRPKKVNNSSNQKRRKRLRYRGRKLSQKTFDDISTDTSGEEKDSIYELPQKISSSAATASSRTLAVYNDVISQGFSKVSSVSKLRSSQEMESANRQLNQGRKMVRNRINRYLDSDSDSSSDSQIPTSNKSSRTSAAKKRSKSTDTNLSDRELDPPVVAEPISASKERSQMQLQSPKRKSNRTSAAKKRSKSPDRDLSYSEQSDTEVEPPVVAEPISASKERSQMQLQSPKRTSNRISAAKKRSKSPDNRKVDPKVAAKHISASKDRSQMQLQSPKQMSNRTSAGNKRSKSPDRDLSYSEQSDTEVEPPVAAEPISASKEKSQMELQSPKRKSNKTSVAKKRSKLSKSKSQDTELSELEQSDTEVSPAVIPKPISASTPKAVRAKPKTGSLDDQLAKFQGNSNMITKAKIDSYLRCLGLNMSDKKLQAVMKISNLYIKKFLDQLSSSTENAHGTFSFSELEAGLQIEKLLPEKSNAMAFEIATAFTPLQLRKMDGILTPKYNDNDTYFN